MKWLADENIPGSTIRFLRQLNQQVLSVAELAPAAPDRKVIQIAVQQECILLSFDRDHGNLVFSEGITPPPAIVYLRLSPPDPESLQRIMSDLINLGEAALTGKFTVVTTDEIRQRPLPGN
jgi:predicted nuclease of predicted toxin-antitoxin system